MTDVMADGDYSAARASHLPYGDHAGPAGRSTHQPAHGEERVAAERDGGLAETWPGERAGALRGERAGELRGERAGELRGERAGELRGERSGDRAEEQPGQRSGRRAGHHAAVPPPPAVDRAHAADPVHATDPADASASDADLVRVIPTPDPAAGLTDHLAGRLGDRLADQHVGADRIGADHLGSGRARSNRVEADRVGSGRAGAGRAGPEDRVGADRVEADRVGAGRGGAADRGGAGRVGTDHRVGTDRAGGDGTGEDAGEDRAGVNQVEADGAIVDFGAGEAGPNRVTSVYAGRGRAVPVAATPATPAGPGGPAPATAVVKGRIQIEDEVVEKIAALAAVDVGGVADLGGDLERTLEAVRGRIGLGRRRGDQGVRTRIEDRQVSIDVTIVIEYGRVVADVAKEVKANVARAVSRMLGLRVVEVNVTVDDVALPVPAAPAAPAEHPEPA